MPPDVVTTLIQVGAIVSVALVCRVLVSSRLPLETVPAMLRHRVEVADRWAPAVLVVVVAATCVGVAVLALA